jgi:hypothetical protein
MHKTLRHLGTNESNYRVLKLLPLVYVAWSSGKIAPEREERLADLAHNHFSSGKDGEQLAYAEAIARTTPYALDAPTSVMPREEWALADSVNSASTKGRAGVPLFES